jgi:chloride channel 7
LAINYCESGNCGTFGTGGLIMFDMGAVSTNIGLMELIPVVILGILGGCLGSLFTFLNGKIVRAYSSWYTT